MSKKKNIAMMMAVASVATTVAPAFATGLEGKSIASNDEKAVAELKSEIEKLLNTRYTEKEGMLKKGAYTVTDKDGNSVQLKEAIEGNCVYNITYTLGKDANPSEKGTEYPITNMEDLDVALARLNDTNKCLNIEVVDNGHKTVDGEVVNWKEAKYTKKEIAGLVINDFITDTEKVNEDTIKLTLKNNKAPLVIKTGDTKLKLEEPILSQDKMGSYLDKKGEIIQNIKTYEEAKVNPDTVVVGFEIDRADLEENKENQDKSDFEAKKIFGVDYVAIKTANFTTKELYDYDISRFTTKGNRLKQYIDKYDAVEVGEENDSDISGVADGKITISFPVDKTKDMKNSINSDAATGNFAQIVVTGSNKELGDLKDALENRATNSIKVLAGDDRFNTAIEVSKDTFVGKEEVAREDKLQANEVVLVSGYALADGLTATPFAAAKQAPVLLTAKDKVSKGTMDEIKRVLGNSGTINVIGGKNTITPAVETQLKAAGYTINRINGDSRYETSLEIAKAMEEKLNGDVYIAGGYAEADAMSIAPIAARGIDDDKGENAKNTTPIILVDEKSGLSKDAIKYISNLDEKSVVNPYIIGGADRAPESIKTQLSNIKPQAEGSKIEKAERLSGDDRQGTNAAVIKKFAKPGDMTNVYVAKSDDKGLVDSLSAGVLAGKNSAPIILATNDLNADQQSVLKSQGIDKSATRTQIGEGVAGQVWSTINSLFKK